MSTTKAHIERVSKEVEMFCVSARDLIHLAMPVGLGREWVEEQEDLMDMLDEVVERFNDAIRKAQREKGWATE